MPSLSQHQSLKYIKALYMGDPGSGKTGSLVSLLKAGYKLRIYDFDNLLGSLVQYAQKDAPDKVSNVAFQTFTDKMKGLDVPVVMNGASMKVIPFVDGQPKAFADAMKQLNYWKTPAEDLGKPQDWGEDTVVVIDSLTTMAAACFRYVQYMNPSAREPQTYYFSAQQLLMQVIALLCSEQFHANVLVLAHIAYDQNQMNLTKGFPRSIGSALNQQIGAYFNCVLMCESSGSGERVKRVIRTNSTGIVDLKNPVSFKVPDTIPIESGLADFFKAVKAN